MIRTEQNWEMLEVLAIKPLIRKLNDRCSSVLYHDLTNLLCQNDLKELAEFIVMNGGCTDEDLSVFRQKYLDGG